MRGKAAVVKDIVKKHIDDFRCGIFFTRNLANDLMETIYDDGEVQIDVCREWAYFEIFGLNNNEEKEVEEYYNEVIQNEIYDERHNNSRRRIDKERNGIQRNK